MSVHDLIEHPGLCAGYEQDRIVNAMIDSDLHSSIVGLAPIGIILLIGSSVPAIHSVRRARQT